ncbi:MAG: hypothetical protein IIX38_03940, partial [Alistipes sp.]|nr:hypothetical protein [Alistipes sp.]
EDAINHCPLPQRDHRDRSDHRDRREDAIGSCPMPQRDRRDRRDHRDRREDAIGCCPRPLLLLSTIVRDLAWSHGLFGLFGLLLFFLRR